MKELARMLIKMNLMHPLVQVTVIYDIFDKEEEIITEGSMVWVNTNKNIWEGGVIKIPFSDVPEDAKI